MEGIAIKTVYRQIPSPQEPLGLPIAPSLQSPAEMWEFRWERPSGRFSGVSREIYLPASLDPQDEWKENMWKDPIVEEIRKIREEFAARHNYDIWEMYKTLKKREAEKQRPSLSFPPRRIQRTQTRKDSA